MKDGLPQVIDVWEEKIRRGWKIEDVPSEAIRKELRRRLNERVIIGNEKQGLDKII